MAATTKPKNIIQIARADLNVRETDGHNRSERIDAMNLGVGNALGDPYCAAGVSDWVRQCGVPRAAFPFSGGSQTIKAYFEHKGLLTYDPNALLDMTCALAGWTNQGGQHGHIFLPVERMTITVRGGGLNVVKIATIECNTSPETGERDGEGVFELHREVPLDRGHRLWFLNLTGLAETYPMLAHWPRINAKTGHPK